MPVRRASRTFRPALPVLALTLALGACDSTPSPDANARAAKATGPSVIAPGLPGEAARTLSPEEAKAQLPDDSPNSADISYARRMIEHHAQAIEITELVPKRAQSTPVKLLAERIAAAQGPEIAAMQGWLEDNGSDDRPTGHTHEAMPGMATTTQLAKLRAARGKAFDELFLTLMITHHEGAVTMATEVKAQGNNVRVEEMADDVIAQQTAEINRMRGM
ncbi:DUF305 domain-containing protein [Streptomyces sp. WI04-05B]|uniref:DUF305 domain-containing protein n=1 Tax=Streptomyces TaxID=1883 RepID=UPI0029BA8C47|nr:MULTISPECIES: DUF305 domain-containing protein [unclassified Streptomyces]MDX2545714.1 DUF305 domain-containing protein [Streptomyces sp. WI04-05B]MDX2583445.1 DUF305 domain-containing protein [Streptomyces sp. WI04-05A]MDX3745213.1 DUF305 domain-containing protein [Streptomyces sp. AK08-02]